MAAVFQLNALRAVIARLACRLRCGRGERASAFELVGPCNFIWRCDLHGHCAERATVFDLIRLCAFSPFAALSLALRLRCACGKIRIDLILRFH